MLLATRNCQQPVFWFLEFAYNYQKQKILTLSIFCKLCIRSWIEFVLTVAKHRESVNPKLKPSYKLRKDRMFVGDSQGVGFW